jgi:outer membrane protein TolC
LLPCGVVAQTLSSQLLVEQVLSANAALHADQSQISAARHRSSYAGDLDDPVLSYSIAPQSIGDSIGTRQIVQLSQTVPTRGKLKDRAALGASVVALAESDLADRRARLVVEARVAWTEWWYLHRALQLNAANQRVLQQLIPVAESQYGAGNGLQQDVLQAQTRSERVRLEAIRLLQQRRRLQAHINRLRGDIPQAEVGAPAALPAWKKLPDSSFVNQQLIAADPRFQQLAAHSQEAYAKLALAKKATTPDLRFSLGYIGTLDPDEKRLQLGVAFSLPLNRGRLRAAADAAIAERKHIAHQVADAKAQIGAELSQALLSAEEATEASFIYRQSLIPKARQTLAAAQADYESTAGEFSNVITAETQLLELQLELARTRADWRIAVAMVERITQAGLWDVAEISDLATAQKTGSWAAVGATSEAIPMESQQ